MEAAHKRTALLIPQLRSLLPALASGITGALGRDDEEREGQESRIYSSWVRTPGG